MILTNGTYQINGVDVHSLVTEFDTPLYVYDAARMQGQYARLKQAFPGNRVRIKYACKALSNLNILRLFRRLGAGLDTVSIQEVRLGLLAGFPATDIIYTPNCVSMSEIRQAVELGVIINIDNISILEQFGHDYGSTVPVSIRINPHIMAGGNQLISTGHIDSKFGISIHQMRHVERVVTANALKVIGLHMHTGSDILDVDVFLRGAEILFNIAGRFAELEFLDFGSGFKVAYSEGDITTDVDELSKRLMQQLDSFCREYGRDVRIFFEPGKYLVSEAGYLLVRTNVIKQTTATVFAGVDSGMNHLIRPMFYNAYHHIINVSNPLGTPRIYTVVGYICETDTFAWDRKINEIREGDILAFFNAGAYAFDMSSNYNSRLKPAEVMVYEGKSLLIRKRETMEDLTRNQTSVEF